MGVIIAKAAGAATYTLAAQAASTTVGTATFLAATGQPGAGSTLPLNLPGTARFNGKKFKVIASGLVKLGANTATVTVQPLIYASTSKGFTVSAAAAIYSAAAISVTQSTASATYVPWEVEITVAGNDTSGTIAGAYEGSYNNGAVAAVSRAAIVNAPTSIDFDAEPPLQFAAGIVTTGGTQGGTYTLTEFRIED